MNNSSSIKKIFWKDVFLDWIVIILCYYWIASADRLLVTIVGMTIIGIEQYRLAILFHDLMHSTIFRKKQTNFLMGNLLFGWWIGIDINSYNRFHGEHHAYNGTIKDPELHDGKGNPIMKMVRRWDLPMSPQKILFWFVAEIILGPIFALMLVFGLKLRNNKNGTITFCWNECLGPALCIGAISILLWKLNAMWIMGIWFMAFAFIFSAVANVRIITEHLGCGEGETFVLAEPTNWYEWLYAVTSGAHNIRYHFEHHNHPKIPYMLLPKKRKENLNTHIKTINLKELFRLLATSPVIKSGEVLKKDDERSLIYRSNL
jgi:fatty acid desaturase